jgi:peroxiredoxin
VIPADDQPRKTTARRFRSISLNTGLFLLVFWVVSNFQSRNMLATGDDAAPELRGTTLAGQAYDLASTEARTTLIYFFAPWCKVCAASADNLVRLRRWRDEANLDIVAVALDWTDTEQVHAYVERHGLDVTVLLGDSTVARRWQVYGFPSYYVLDSRRHIARSDIGYSTQLGLWWRTWAVN